MPTVNHLGKGRQNRSVGYAAQDGDRPLTDRRGPVEKLELSILEKRQGTLAHLGSLKDVSLKDAP
jgi:hypothetical protein